MNNIALLTAKIKIDPTTLNTIPDQLTREKHYEDNIIFLLAQSNINIIVFCENSNTTLKNLKTLQQLAKQQSKTLEYLTFSGNPILGKGAGESEIIEYALQHSLYIKNNTFYKITGRWQIKNINHIIKNSDKLKNIFYKQSINKKLALTAFFMTDALFFRKYLMDCGKEVDPTKWDTIYCLESIYYKRLYKIKPTSLSIYPHFEGLAGKGVALKKNKIALLIKDVLCRLQLYSI